MNFDRFTDDVQIGDASEPSDIVECDSCGRDIERDPFEQTENNFCHDGCRADYNGA